MIKSNANAASAILAALILVTAGPVAANDAFRCVDRDGRVFYQGTTCGSTLLGGAMLYKCQGAKGAVSIQSAPCPEKSKTVWARPAEPEVETEESRRRQQDVLRQQSADARALSRQAGTDRRTAYNALSGPTEHAQRLAQCNAAKRHRDDILNQVGLRRTYQLLQDLDRQVAAACRGL